VKTIQRIGRRSKNEQCGQGDQIFAQRAIVYFGKFKKQKTYMYIPQYFATFCHEHFSYINFDKKWIGLHFWRFFSQTHLGTLNVVDTRVTRWFCKKAPIMCEAQPSFSHI
jgi:hypothetical protein